MGDLLPPKVREEVSRLRRRLVELRQHHGIRQDRYNQTIPHGYEQQNQDTHRLHQKLLESRAKKAAKVTKTNKDTSSQPDQRNNPITQQKKRKHDNNSSGDGGGAANVDAYTFDEPDEPANKALRGNGTGNSENGGRGDGGSNNQLHQSVSVNIVQQIDTHADPQTNRIKLTVSSTLQTSGLGAGAKVGQSVTSTSVETSTNICKQEPVDNDQCPGSSNSSQNSFHDPIGLEDVDEIKAILDTLEREEGAIPPELIKELDLGFKEGFEDSDSLSSSSHPDTSKGAELAAQQQPASGLSHRSPMFNSGSHSTKSSPGPGMFADPLYDSSTHAAPVNPSLSAMGGQGAAAMANYHRPPTGGGAAPPPPILPVGDTGPAAETLKQMAAQHQTQHQNQEAAGGGGGYPMKGQMPYGAPEYVDYTRRYTPHGYPPYPGQNYPMSATAQANMYPYNQQVPMPNHRAGHMAVQSMQGKDPSMNYGGTKPLSHYPGRMGGGGPSSLQQLQNQVQSHFGQGPNQNGAGPGGAPHLQISQTQHMQMTHGAGARMQMTQSQQMQIHNASPQISVAQQQSFSMGPQGAPPRAAQYHMNNQMKMQMMNQQQQQQHQQQAQGAPTGGPQPPPGSVPPQHPNMQSYMNRPPPEYKVPPGGVNNNYGQNANPLQTMQNMVNQTSQSGPAQNGMYPHPPPGGPPPQQIKTEGTPPTAATGAGANRASPLLTGPPNGGSSMGPGPTNSPSGMRNYGQPGQPGGPAPGQMMPGQMPNGTATGASMKAPTQPNTQYTSAIMRNQRPPNVNVGPDGLNISQQRSHSGEWPRTMNPGGAGAPPQMVARPGMPGNNMMPYGAGAYQGQQGARPMAGHMDAANLRMHMSQQQAVMTSGQPGAMGSHMHPGMAPGGGSTGSPQTMMLQQQQALQVSHSNMAASMSQTISARVSSPQSHPQQQQQQQQQSQQQPQQQPQATQQQQQQRQQPSPQQQQQQQSQQQPPQPQPPQQQQQQPHPTSQSPHGPHPGYPHQSSTQHANSEFPLDFLDNVQGNGFFDSMVPHSGDFFDDLLFGK